MKRRDDAYRPTRGRPLTDAEREPTDERCRDCGDRLNAYEAEHFAPQCAPCATADVDLWY